VSGGTAPDIWTNPQEAHAAAAALTPSPSRPRSVKGRRVIFVLPTNPIALASGDFFAQVLAGAW
jgi:hypothetical protein